MNETEREEMGKSGKAALWVFIAIAGLMSTAGDRIAHAGIIHCVPYQYQGERVDWCPLSEGGLVMRSGDWKKAVRKGVSPEDGRAGFRQDALDSIRAALAVARSA